MRTAWTSTWLGQVIVAEGLHPSGGLAVAKGVSDRAGMGGGGTTGTKQSFRYVGGDPPRRGARWLVLIAMLLSMVCAAGEHGVTARFVPDQVRPGDVFELRVDMKRAEYGRFELLVPSHGSLHRVAVESEPVRLEGGFYRQRERWMLQADRSGEIVIDDASVVLETGGGGVPVVLPPLRVEVTPWGGADTSVVPVAFPEQGDVMESKGAGWWWVVPVLGCVCLFAWWLRRPVAIPDDGGPGGVASVQEALEDLDAGRLRSLALEQLRFERGDAWSRELREAVEQAVYAGRGDAAEVARLLRKEVGT